MDLIEKPQENQGFVQEQQLEHPGVMADEIKSIDEKSGEGNSVVEVLGILSEEEIQKHDASRVADALFELFGLLYCDGDEEKADKNKQEAHSQGAHASILRAMAKFETDEDVQTYGCRCITAFFYSKGVLLGSLEVAENIRLQIVQCIAKAAENFPGCPRVQRACYGALINLLARTKIPFLFGRGPDASPSDEGMYTQLSFCFESKCY